MRLADVRRTYAQRSKAASDISRQLGFAGLGLVWILRTREGGLDAIPGALLLPSALLILGLGLDLLHAVVGTAISGGYQRALIARGVPEDFEFRAPRWFNWPTLFCFWAKLAAIAWAYVMLVAFMWRALV